LSGQVGFPKAVIGSGPVGPAEMWIGTSRTQGQEIWSNVHFCLYRYVENI